MSELEKRHTPGPWKHVPREDDEGFMSFDGPNGETIVGGCGCCCSPFGNSADSGHTYYRPTEEDRANARLIAAAPDLLAACEAVLPWVVFATNDYDPDRHPKSIQNAKDDLAQLMEAIRKAKGNGD